MELLRRPSFFLIYVNTIQCLSYFIVSKRMWNGFVLLLHCNLSEGSNSNQEPCLHVFLNRLMCQNVTTRAHFHMPDKCRILLFVESFIHILYLMIYIDMTTTTLQNWRYKSFSTAWSCTAIFGPSNLHLKCSVDLYTIPSFATDTNEPNLVR